MNYDEIFRQLRRDLPGLGWDSIFSGKSISMIAGVSQQLRIIGIECDVVKHPKLKKMPLLKIDDDYYGVFGKIQNNDYEEIGIENISNETFSTMNELDIKRIASWMRIEDKEFEENLILVKDMTQKLISDYIKSENPMRFEKGSVEEKLYYLHRKGFDISKTMFHETKLENKNSIIENGFDLSKQNAANSDYEMPTGVFVKPDDRPIYIYEEECIQIPFFLKKGSHVEIDKRENVCLYLSQISPEWKKLSDERKSNDDRFNSEYEKIEKELIEVINKNSDRKEELKSEIKYKMNKLMLDWGGMIERIAPLAKKEINRALKKYKIDSMRVKEDEGAWGRKADTTVILNPDDLVYANMNELKIELKIEFNSEATFGF